MVHVIIAAICQNLAVRRGGRAGWHFLRCGGCLRDLFLVFLAIFPSLLIAWWCLVGLLRQPDIGAAARSIKAHSFAGRPARAPGGQQRLIGWLWMGSARCKIGFGCLGETHTRSDIRCWQSA